MASLYVDRRDVHLQHDAGAIAFYENGQRSATVPLAPITRVILRGKVTLEAGLLGQLRDLHTVSMVRIPTGTDLEGDRNVHGGHHCLQDIAHQGGILQQGGAGELLVHLLGWTPHIDVDDLCVGGHIELGCLRHQFGVTTEDLYRTDTGLIGMDSPFL